MKRLVLTAVVLCAFGGAVIRAADNAPQKTPPAPTTRPTTQPAAPVNKFCAVETENPVDPGVPTVVYDGKVIGFCCEDCIPKFKKHPELYMKGLK